MAGKRRLDSHGLRGRREGSRRLRIEIEACARCSFWRGEPSSQPRFTCPFVTPQRQCQARPPGRRSFVARAREPRRRRAYGRRRAPSRSPRSASPRPPPAAAPSRSSVVGQRPTARRLPSARRDRAGPRAPATATPCRTGSGSPSETFAAPSPGRSSSAWLARWAQLLQPDERTAVRAECDPACQRRRLSP